jgi:hypothetical protein
MSPDLRSVARSLLIMPGSLLRSMGAARIWAMAMAPCELPHQLVACHEQRLAMSAVPEAVLPVVIPARQT